MSLASLTITTYTVIDLFLIAGFGLIFGSFLNVLILRSVTGGSLLGRSHCPHCKRVLGWTDLIPVVSYVILRGKCQSCHKKISVQYPLVEIASAIAFLFLFPNIPAIIFSLILLVLFVVDLKSYILPDFFVVLLGVVALLFGPASYMGMLIGGGFLFFLWIITSGRGIGFGDVKLGVVLGLWFGPTVVSLLLAGAFIVGGAVGACLLLTKQATRKTAIPFGPFLTGMAMLLLLFPQSVLVIWNFFMPGFIFG